MALNSDQKKALYQLKNWVKNWDTTPEKELLLAGPGGTGKTHIISEFVEYLQDSEIPFTVAAPTMAAVSVLEKRVTCRVKTIQSVLSQFAWEDTYGELHFAKPTDYLVKRKVGKLIIVDEWSMISQAQYKALKKSGVFIVAVGDEKQLPPVRAKKNTLWQSAKRITLTQQMRHTGEIGEVSNKNRKSFYCPQLSKGNVKVYRSYDSLKSEFFRKIESASNPQDCRFLSYTNHEARLIASETHELLFGGKDFSKGQHLLLDRTISKLQVRGMTVSVSRVLGESEVEGCKAWDIEALNLSSGATKVITVMSPDNYKLFRKKLDSIIEKIHFCVDYDLLDQAAALRDEHDDLDLSVTPVLSPYSTTVHKSQGSTIPYIWVDSNGLKGKRDLHYVAVSRASKELHLLATPPEINSVKVRDLYSQLHSHVLDLPEWDKPKIESEILQPLRETHSSSMRSNRMKEFAIKKFLTL